MQLEEVLREFIFEVEIKKFTKKTIKGYRNNNALFLNFLDNEFGVTELEDLQPVYIKKYFQHLTKKGRKPTYINGILKTIRAFCVYCVEEGYLKDNPAYRVKWQKEPKVLINTFTQEEINNMLSTYKFTDYLDGRNKLIVAMLVDTGIRNQELCDIKNEDIKEKVILIHGKGTKERQVSISPLLKKYMMIYERIREEYFKNYNLKHNYYFISYRGEPLTVGTVENIVRKAGKKANVRKEIRCSPHTIRHWYAQEQLRNGLDVYSLSRLLGHENITITKRYLQSIQDEDIVDLSVKTSPLMNLKGGRR